MNAEIIAIGTELVSGQRIDTNSHWLSQQLAALGVSVRFHTTVGDDLGENVQALKTAVDRVALVILTGGLGPTQDDLTREALAQATGQPLVEDPGSLAALEAFFARRNRTMPERNRVQAFLPRGATALSNPSGTAPGVWMPVGAAHVAALPGVPSEMKGMFLEGLVPRLRGLGVGQRVIVHRIISTFGKGESEIEAQALDLTLRGRRPEVGITASDATISFRISCEAPTEAEALLEMEPTLALIRDRFNDLILGETEGEDVPHALVRELARTGATLATAESCTGGLIGHRITAIPGVSSWYLGGVICYSNAAKTDQVGVPESLIAAHGAVSPEVAESLAAGIRSRFHAQIGLAVTGIAGPGGGTAEKPVGLVHLGLATAEGVYSRRLELGPEQPRSVIQSRAAKHAMNWVRQTLRGRA